LDEFAVFFVLLQIVSGFLIEGLEDEDDVAKVAFKFLRAMKRSE